MKKLLSFLLVLLALQVTAQIEEPVKWSYAAQKISEGDANILIKAQIDKGWHLYSQFIEEGGPIPTSFKFSPSADFKLIGKVAESPKAVAAFDNNFGMKIAWHENSATFTQKIKTSKSKLTVKGVLEFMVCNDRKCLPPTEVEFSIPVDMSTALVAAVADTVSTKPADTVVKTKAAENIAAVTKGPAGNDSSSLWAIFIAGFLGGLAAFFMPCIYPMIPLTVSYFTKKSGSKAKGIQSAVIYGLSIIVIYVALGLAITLIFGTSALNEAASSATFNLLFFALLVVFAISFLGAFEITLPSTLVNKMDEQSNRSGLVGLFFMAFTLALVSFSCTGPIIGTLLVDAVAKGTYLGPAMGMFGFSAALAIPFTLFAIFPSWLKEMPKSGGWLNTVKVSLGFLELALAFKFLSNVDLAYHWGIFNRDIFLIIWIVIFTFWGLYLLGKIKLAHDSELPFISLPRLLFSMLVWVFTLYMIPGLWGAPLKGINAWLPPLSTQDFDLNKVSSFGGDLEGAKEGATKKYANLFHAPYGLNAFYDYEEGLAYAKKQNKPVLIDFTGWSCTNCRKMEASVWSDPEVLKRLKEDYVLISLYVDDKTELAESEKYTSRFSGKNIKTLGQKWSDFQAATFGTNSQPYYVIVNADGKQLVSAQAFNLDINNYIRFLDSGKIVSK
ncbi:MAG: cytochrome c biogenesis protein CcdA [Sphingobacteriaceae bacterium]